MIHDKQCHDPSSRALLDVTLETSDKSVPLQVQDHIGMDRQEETVEDQPPLKKLKWVIDSKGCVADEDKVPIIEHEITRQELPNQHEVQQVNRDDEHDKVPSSLSLSGLSSQGSSIGTDNHHRTQNTVQNLSEAHLPISGDHHSLNNVSNTALFNGPGGQATPSYHPQPSQPNQENMNTSAEYLTQLLKDQKQIQAFPGCFFHLERLLNEG